jgi:hypothetical protein
MKNSIVCSSKSTLCLPLIALLGVGIAYSSHASAQTRNGRRGASTPMAAPSDQLPNVPAVDPASPNDNPTLGDENPNGNDLTTRPPDKVRPAAMRQRKQAQEQEIQQKRRIHHARQQKARELNARKQKIREDNAAAKNRRRLNQISPAVPAVPNDNSENPATVPTE